MSLIDLVDNSRTDKDTVHSYLPLYQRLLHKKKTTAKRVLEVGIEGGGSLKLWSDFFPNATVYGIDFMNRRELWEGVKKENIILHTSTNAYDELLVKTYFSDKHIIFDVLLDNGPHTLESMKKFIQLYSPLMTEDGILIIEDVQCIDWIDVLQQEVPDKLKQYVQVYDLRPIKNRYDDIIFTIDKTR
jgi:hypothetical protein